MDRPIEPQIIRKRRIRKFIAALAVLGAGGIAATYVLGWVRPSLVRSNLRTATVERGPVDATITASGTVTPATETVLSSPVEARIVRIVRRPGALLQPGESILELDLSESVLDVNRLEQQLARKRNERQRTSIDLETSLTQLRSQLAQKELDGELFRARADRNRRLLSEGLVSDEMVRESETAARKALIEVEQIGGQIAQAQRSAAAEMAAIDLDQQILEKEIGLARRQLELATARSDRNGVLTWVAPEEGVTVRRGETLARIADLGSFRIEASASDLHAPKLEPGGQVRVRLNDERLAGTIAAVDPTISNGLVRFSITLDEPAHRSLRNNQRVDLHVIAGRSEDVVKVRRGSFVDEGRSAVLYVLEQDRAVRRTVRFGIVGDEEVEIVEGLRPGEVIVMNDLSDYRDVAKFRIR